ncbi:uncharacterized protein LOC111905646 [Lactuca sativa]|uniref:uncharacterized protein LOC111905646 n=1 Tax=Lactuca sativa TaxID=4236 RepID=UPI0022B07A0C|nr:uncharacterized protein LOC111905646 [Lactuca sativa]
MVVTIIEVIGPAETINGFVVGISEENACPTTFASSPLAFESPVFLYPLISEKLQAAAATYSASAVEIDTNKFSKSSSVQQWQADRMQDYINGLDEELWSCISGNVNVPVNVQTIGSSSTNSSVDNQTDRLKKLEKRQKEGETIEVYYDRLNELIYRCNGYGISMTSMEVNLIFVMGLRKEWKSISMMVKNEQSFDTSTLNDLYNQLKTHETEVNEIVEETKLNLGGPLALVSNISEKEAENGDSEEEEGFIMNSYDEAIVFYSNNRLKKFFKKSFNLKAKLAEVKGSERLEEVRAKAKNLSLVAKGEHQDEDGTYQIWSSGSNDEETRNPTHGAMYAKIEEDSDDEEFEEKGRCFVSKTADKSPMTTKVQKIIESFNIPRHAYNSELISFNETVSYFDSIVVSASNEANKLSMELLETKKRLDMKINNFDNISEISEFEDVDCSQLFVVNVVSIVKGKEKIKDLMVEKETDIPPTSKVCDMNFVNVKDSQTDDSDDEDEEKFSKGNKSSKEEETPRIVVDQVYGNTQKFKKVMTEKGEHYLETNIVVYSNFKCTDDVIFPNQVFVTIGNVENIKPELKKFVEEDNSKTTDEGFFANQSTVENNLTKNSYVFQRQKPQTKWVQKLKIEKENSKQVVKENENFFKLNSKEFKDQIDKFSKENNISKRQARKKIFWQNIESQKMSKSQSSKSVFKAKNFSFSTKTQHSSQSNHSRSEVNKQQRFTKVSETNIP